MIHKVSQPIKQVTVRSLDAALSERIRELAQREGLSLNQAIVRLLRKGAGLEEPAPGVRHRIGTALDDFIATWSDREADALLDSLETFEQVDEELWK